MSEDFVEIFEHRKTNCSANFWQFAVDPPTVLCNPMFEPEIEGYSQCLSPAQPGPNGPAFANRKRLCCVQREDFERVFIEHGCPLSAKPCCIINYHRNIVSFANLQVLGKILPQSKRSDEYNGAAVLRAQGFLEQCHRQAPSVKIYIQDACFRAGHGDCRHGRRKSECWNKNSATHVQSDECRANAGGAVARCGDDLIGM